MAATAPWAAPDVTAPLPGALARAISDRVETASGIRIDPAKTDFIRLRVGRRLRALGLPDYESYVRVLETDADGTETRHLVEALTTHTTSFFREARQYDWLAGPGLDLLSQDRGRAPLTVWSAACSLGAELWSAGMVLHQADAAPRDWQLIGTDISRRVLRRAENATFAEDELEGLSPDRRARFLLRSRRLRDGSGRPIYRIVPDLRRRARFLPANLRDLRGVPRFRADVIFLRNVLIYFPAETQAQVVAQVLTRLRPGGVLLTGHAEQVPAQPGLMALAPSIYQRV